MSIIFIGGRPNESSPLVLPLLSPLLSGHQALGILSCLNFNSMVKENLSEIESDDRLWTSSASPVALFFQNR